MDEEVFYASIWNVVTNEEYASDNFTRKDFLKIDQATYTSEQVKIISRERYLWKIGKGEKPEGGD